MYKKILIFCLLLFLGSAINSSANVKTLNGLDGQNQVFVNDSNIRINSSGTTNHNIIWFGSLPVFRGGTGLKTLASGQLLFGDTVASISQSSNLLWDKNNDRLGIGTSTPGYRIDVQGGQINASGGLCIANDCRTTWFSLNGQTGNSQTFVNDTNITLTSLGNIHTLGWSGVLSINRGGTNNSAFTNGSIPFFDGMKLAENNSQLLWDDVNNRLGIGTTTPGYKLDVVGGQINASGGLCIAGDCKTSWPVLATASGSVNYVSKFTNQNSLGNSQIFDDGTGIGIGTTNPGGSKLKVNGVIESATGGVKFPDGTTQTTAAVSSKYVKMGYDTENAPLSISANTPTIIPDLSVTRMTGANNLKLSFTIPARLFAGSGNISRSSWTFVVDGVGLRTYTFDTAGTSNQPQPVNAYNAIFVMSTSAGSHTVQVKVSANTSMEVLDGGTLIVEEIAP